MIPALVFAAATLTEVVACPSLIRDSQKIESVHLEWSIKVDGRPRRLEDADVFSGDPSGRFLLPSETGHSGATIWKFSGEDVWVQCHYLDSAATLTRRLGRSIVSCRFSPAPTLTTKPAQMTCAKK